MSSIKLDVLLKIGSASLNTTAQTLCEAVNELKTAIDSISLIWDGTPSSTGVRKQQLNVSGTFYDIEGSAYMEQRVTLSTSDVTLATFTNVAIEAGSAVDVFVEDWAVVPENVSVASGTCVVTLPKVDTAANVYVRITLRKPVTQGIVGPSIPPAVDPGE